MDDPSVSSTVSRFSPAALAALLSVAAVCSTRAVLSDGDTFTHVAVGRWVIEHWTIRHWAVPTVDPLSATFGGMPWLAHEWLSEVVLGLAYELTGLPGLVVVTGVAVGLTFGGMARHVRRRCGWRATVLLTMAGLACVMPHLVARPHVLVLPLLEAWVAALMRARDARRMPSVAVLPVMTVWANMHGSFAFGLALAAAFAGEASLHQSGAGRLRPWWFLGGAVCAALITPGGVEGLLFPVRLMRLRSLLFITEWQPIERIRPAKAIGVVG